MAINWRSIGDVPQATFNSVLEGTPLFGERILLYGLAKGYTALLLAQAYIESNLGTSAIAKSKKNFLGQRPRGGDGFKTFPTFAECARYWIEKLTDPNYAYADTATLEEFVHVYAPASDGNDEAEYVATVLALLARWGVTLPEGDQEMPTYTTEIPGLPGGPLVTTYPIHIKLIPTWRTNNRPGTKAKTPRLSVIHGNGNPNSSAAGEATYLYNGAEGRQASYHSAADDKEVWVMVPADEVTWQAADGFNGPGNNNGFSCETVEDANLWANPQRRDRLIDIAADFNGRVAARLGIAKPQQHWDFNFALAPSQRHDCPNKLRYTRINGRLAWDIFAGKWQAAKADELKRMNPKPEPAWQPHPIGNEATKDGQTKYENDVLWVWVHQEQPIEVDTQTYEWADDTSRKGIILPAGKPVTAYWMTTVDNELWASTRQGYRWRVADGLKKAA